MKNHMLLPSCFLMILVAAAWAGAGTGLGVRPDTPDPGGFCRAGEDTVLFENFDDVAVGEVPEGWSAVDLSAIPDTTLWCIDDAISVEGFAWWIGTEEGLPDWGFQATPPGYGNLWRQYLDLSYDLTGQTGVIVLRMDQWFHLEFATPEPPFDTWDAANVRISTDGGQTFDVLEPIGGYPYDACYAFWLADGDTVPGFSSKSGEGLLQPEWEQIQYNLTSYKETTGIIRFYMCADMYASDEDGGFDSNNGAWAIDNVLIGTATGDTIFFDDVESGQLTEWDPKARPPNIVGNYWETVDDTHLQPDDRDVYYSSPHGLYCGDQESSQGNGTYYVGDHNSWGLDNVLLLPEIDLTNWNNPVLNFQQRLGANVNNGGYCYIEISEDEGASWQNWTNYLSPEIRDWHEFTTPMTLFEGETILMRFHSQTGTLESHYLYWYLDDICISGDFIEGVNRIHLSALLDNGTVFLKWEGSAADIQGYRVCRREGAGDFTPLTDGMLQSSTSAFEDSRLRNGARYEYLVEMVTDGDDVVRSNTVSVDLSTMPRKAVLEQNYPNPFNPMTVIRYSVDDAGDARVPVSVRIFNTQGELVQTLVDHPQRSGTYSTTWNGRDHGGRAMPTGVYYCHLKCGESTAIRKMILMK